MRFHDSDEFRRQEQIQLLHTGPSLTREEGREIFREMVRAETRNGPLNPLRRRRLIQYAAALKLTPLEAGKIITEVCRENERLRGQQTPVIYRMVEAAAAPRRWPVWLKIGLPLAAAFAIDRIVRCVL